MFANTNLCAMNFSFPDVCDELVVVAVVPLPFVNIAISITHIPSQFNVIISCGLGENLLTIGTISNGDEPGILLGVASGMIIGPDRYFLGSFKTMIGGIFGSRLTSLTGQNGMSPNMVGITLAPSQVRVILLG